MGVMLSSQINAPGLYATQDINERLQIIETYRTRWLISQALVVPYILLTIVGFSLLASILRTEGKAWVPILGVVAIIAGALAALYFVYLQMIDPRGGYSGAYPTPEILTYWFWLAGMLLFGIAFLQAGLPAWLGYLTAGVAVLYGIVFLLTGAGFMTPYLLALLSLITAIVIWPR
ncbi:MAG TPA: hypothetical protein VK851_03425 [Anaerolineales bacterium]|nr:hypothetical protein [Anaerolineales bacterium]